MIWASLFWIERSKGILYLSSWILGETHAQSPVEEKKKIATLWVVKCYRRDQYSRPALLFERSPLRSLSWSPLSCPWAILIVWIRNERMAVGTIKPLHFHKRVHAYQRKLAVAHWLRQSRRSTGALYIMRETLLLRLCDSGRILTCRAGLFCSAGLTWHPY